jgi:HPt (histidine-containing phosphotransfer) domain-containing protein
MFYLDRILCVSLLALVPCTMTAQEPESDVLALDSLLNTPIDASDKYQQTAREAASEHLPVLLAELDQGLSRGDVAAVQRAAHSLKGSVGNFAHTRSFELCLRLEQIGRSGSLDGAAEVCAELHRAVEGLVSLLGEFTEPAVLPK